MINPRFIQWFFRYVAFLLRLDYFSRRIIIFPVIASVVLFFWLGVVNPVAFITASVVYGYIGFMSVFTIYASKQLDAFGKYMQWYRGDDDGEG